jgi:phosphohistidine swiveling domain-containing protein
VLSWGHELKNASYGPKADNLKQLEAAGFNVPGFYVIPADKKSDISSANAKHKLQSDFEKWIEKHDISAVAVRSSSTQEDSKAQSFAGQFKTVLDVRESDDFIVALKEVFGSKQSEVYSNKSGAIHVIVQQFIEPDISGVVFSINPANGNNELVINAASGRGTNVVEGQQAEQYFVNRLDPSNYTRKSDYQNSATLTETQIQALTSMTLKAELLFRVPQDIEWAIKGDTLYILQARPITQISHLRLWDSSNISESFPGVVLPLTFSVAKRGYLLGYKAQAYSAGLSWYELEAHHRTFDSMIGIFNGKMYYNLLSWYKFISLFPGSARNQKFLDDQIATQGEAVYQIPTKQSGAFKIKFMFRMLYRAIFFHLELKRFYLRFARLEAELARMPQAGDSQLLMMQYTHIEQTIIPHFGRTVDNDFFVMSYHGWLKKLLNKWLSNQPFERNNMIGSISGVLSAEQALSLYKLAERFKSDQEAFRLLKKADYKALDNHLLDTELQGAIAEYIQVFGHRFAEDQKIEAMNPTLEPFGIYKLMEAYIQLDGEKIKERLTSSASTSKTTENDIKSQLRFDQGIIYTVLLGRLKHHLRLREKNRLLRGKTYGYLRDLFPKIGQALVDENIVKVPDDVYYLQIEEIYQLMQGSLITNDLSGRIEKRRQAYAEFTKIDMPERFITKGMPSLEVFETTNLTSSKAVAKDSLVGLISSPGTVEGRVVVLREPKIPKEPYDILVAKHTDPGWTPLIALAKGVIVEHGGMLSHAAIVTRELGIPSIIGVQNVTSVLKTGMRVRINTQTSSVEIIE